MPEPLAGREDATFVDAHGVTIHYHRWAAAGPRAIVQIVHGLGEYAARYEHLAQRLVADGYTVYADDHRGHGQTGLEQWGGDYSKLGRLGPGGVRAAIGAVRQLSEIIAAAHPGTPIVLIGHSLGSFFAQKIIAADSRPYAAVVLSGTSLSTLRHANSFNLNKRHAHLGPTTAEWLSRDRAIVDAFANDPLTFEATTLKLFGLDALRLLGRPQRLARELPMLILNGEEDAVGSPPHVTRLAAEYRERAGLRDVTLKIYPGARHEVYNEVNRDEVIDDLLAWLDARLTH